MSKKIRLAGIAYESLVNGPGMRRVYFSQGCRHNCEGCFNPDTHDFNGGEERDMDELIEDALDNPLLKGITFSGGDPLERAAEFAYMAKAFKKAGLNIWCYTGYTFEKDLLFGAKSRARCEATDALLRHIDVLVDGEFQIEKKDIRLKFRGSSNQRILDLPKSLAAKKAVWVAEFEPNDDTNNNM